MNLFLCFLAMTFTLWPHNVSAQTIQRCTEQLQERTAAMTARDWSSLDKLAKRYVQSCHGVTDALDISTAYEDMAIANLLMNRVQNALEAANSCVTTYYANPGCHLQKARALLAFNRPIEARDLLNVTERLLQSALQQNDRDLSTAYTPSDRRLYLARQRNYESRLKSVEALRAQSSGY